MRRAFDRLAVDLGEKPSVISAVVKYHSTERCRIVINDAMDVHGGKAICLGPDNYLGRLYQQMPVAITVEGANILTRTLMIFGPGSDPLPSLCAERKSRPRTIMTTSAPCSNSTRHCSGISVLR